MTKLPKTDYCKMKDKHRLYHAIGLYCDCFAETLGESMVRALVPSRIDYQKLGRELFQVEPLPCPTIPLFLEENDKGR